MGQNKIEKILEKLPRSCGVYLMKTARGKIVYIGKAKNLRSRVRSYFSPKSSDTRFFARHVHEIVKDIEIVLTASEKEALLLESTLIKEHSPRFNILLRDDKSFLSLRLDPHAKWPKLEMIRHPRKDKALYFGPYHSSTAARETLRIVNRNFRLRSCKDRHMANRIRPCLQHQIHRCLGPCVLEVDHNEYMSQVNYVRLFLLGRREELLDKLVAEMKTSALEYNYERAATLRDQIDAIKSTLAPQHVMIPGGKDQDIVGLCREGDQVQLVVLEVRKGRLIGKSDFHFTGQEFPDDELISSFLMQRYMKQQPIPDEIITPCQLEDKTPLEEVLFERRNKKTAIIYPKRGQRVDQLALASINAKQILETRLQDADNIANRLAAIQKRLHLPKPPKKIECVDISHLSGSNTVGAISVVLEGHVNRAGGRIYRVRIQTHGDDYSAMKEVLSRRFTRASHGETGWEAPDLLVVDGGRGQLLIARSVLADMGLDSQPVVSLAKERTGNQSAETDRIFIPGRKNPIPIKPGISPLLLLALARDEAHRLAITYQRKLRKKKVITSELDDIPGVGPKLRAALLKEIGSMKKIRAASFNDLTKVAGIGSAIAKKIKRELDRS
jgi:excinuclease ABC subunit C